MGQDAFYKLVSPGTGPNGRVFCEILYRDGELSITGVVGPLSNGDCRGSCGQIVDHLTEDVTTYSDGWSRHLLLHFADLWDRWHLNKMRAGCEHQRAEKWDERPIDRSKPLHSYGKHHPNQNGPTWNMLTWVSPEEVPGGLLCAPCPVCGYRYGSAWLTEEVPDHVLASLRALPDSTVPLRAAWQSKGV